MTMRSAQPGTLPTRQIHTSHPNEPITPTKDGTQSPEVVGTPSGGSLGLVLGIIGGPFNALIGGATGLMVGSLRDRPRRSRNHD